MPVLEGLSEFWLKKIFEASPDAITVTDLEGNIIDCNPAAVDRLGYSSKEELIGKSAFEFFAKKDRERAMENLKKTLEQGSVRNVEYTFISKDGHEFPRELSTSIIKDSSGSPIGFVAIVKNITERKKAEEQIKQLQEFLQLQIDRMPIALIVWDTEFRVKTWNPAATRIFGFSEEEALGKHPYDFIVPKQAQPHVDGIWRRLLEGDETAHSVNENLTKDGRTIICAWTNTPLKKDDGTVIGVLSMTQDATERKKAEERIDYLNKMLRAIIGVNQTIIKEKDRDKLLKDACELLVENKGYYDAWIALFDKDRKFSSFFRAGVSETFNQLVEMMRRGELPECGRRALEKAGVHVIREPLTDCPGCPLAKPYFSRSVLISQLKCNDRIYGLIKVSVPTDMVLEDERTLFRDVAGDISYALHTFEVEEEKKLSETRIRELIYRLNGVVPGECYLSESHELCLKAFVDLTLRDVSGLCIVRENPEKSVEEYGLKAEQILLISSRPLKGFRALSNLQEVSLAISEFLKAGGGIVFLDGLEYLISNFGFIPIYKMLQEKRFDFIDAGAVLLVPVNFETLDNKEKALLLSELKILK